MFPYTKTKVKFLKEQRHLAIKTVFKKNFVIRFKRNSQYLNQGSKSTHAVSKVLRAMHVQNCISTEYTLQRIWNETLLLLSLFIVLWASYTECNTQKHSHLVSSAKRQFKLARRIRRGASCEHTAGVVCARVYYTIIRRKALLASHTYRERASETQGALSFPAALLSAREQLFSLCESERANESAFHVVLDSFFVNRPREGDYFGSARRILISSA